MSMTVTKATLPYSRNLDRACATWAQFDRITNPKRFRTRQENDDNLAALFSGRVPPRIMIPGAGRCVEFTLNDVVRKSSCVTLVDLREAAMKAAFRLVHPYEQDKIEMVCADLCPFDVNEFDRAIERILEEEHDRSIAINRCLGIYRKLEFNLDPFAWVKGSYDLIVMAGVLGPVIHDHMIRLQRLIMGKWPGLVPHELDDTNPALKSGAMLRYHQAYSSFIRARLAPGGLLYAVVYKNAEGQELYPLKYYADAFANEFRLLKEVLPHEIVEADPCEEYSNHALLFEAV
jgi:hypothetical protein